MRKALLLVFVAAFTFFFIGCGGDNANRKPAPTAITITAASTEVIVGEQLQLACTVTPSTADNRVTWSTGDANIVKIVNANTGLIEGLAVGKTTITVTSKADSKIKDSVEIEVKPIVYDDPESVSVTAPRNTVSIGSVLQLTATVAPATAEQKVTFTSSNEDVATVSATGVVTGVALGEVVITVMVDADETITTTFQVYVIHGSLTVESVVIQGETEMFEGDSITLQATVLPAGVSQNVIWSSSNETIATVSDKGVVSALKQGSVTITAVSVEDSTVSSSHVILVKPEVPSVVYPDLGGYKIIMYASPGYEKEHDPFLTGYIGSDITAKQQAWNDVEQLFNCDLDVQPYPDEAPWGDLRVQWLVQKAQTNAAEADILVVTGLWTKALVEGNAILDTQEWYAKYGRNKMPPAMKAAGTYRGGLYNLIYSAADGINVYYGIFYNYNLLNDYSLESPAKLFNEGRWSYTDFKNYVLEAQSKMTGKTVLSGKPVLYWAGMVNAGGVALTDSLTLNVNFSHQYAIAAAQVLRDTYVNNCWGDQGWDHESASFRDGNTLFSVGEYWFVKTDIRWPDIMWGDDTRYGFVPFPYPDNINKESTRTVNLGGQYYALGAGRNYPAGVTAENIYWAWTETILRTEEYMLQDPTYHLDSAMRQEAMSRFDDPESADALIFFKKDKVIFDPFTSLLSYMPISNEAIDPIVNNGEDYMQKLTPFVQTYMIALQDMYG